MRNISFHVNTFLIKRADSPNQRKTPHLLEAKREEILITILRDIAYLATKVSMKGPAALEQDLSMAHHQELEDALLALLHRHIARIAHVLLRGQTRLEIEGILLCHLRWVPGLEHLCSKWEQEALHPMLVAWRPLPELRDFALKRSWENDHGDRIAMSADGSCIISITYRELAIWNAQTGQRRLIHTRSMNDCAISCDGSFIVSAYSDGSLRIWDTQTGQEQLTLTGHTEEVNDCAISCDGSFIVSASSDETLKIWDTQTGQERLTLTGHAYIVKDCAISPDGSFIVSAAWDHTLKIWLTQTGKCISTYYAQGTFSACAIHPDGELLVAAGNLGLYFLRLVW